MLNIQEMALINDGFELEYTRPRPGGVIVP